MVLLRGGQNNTQNQIQVDENTKTTHDEATEDNNNQDSQPKDVVSTKEDPPIDNPASPS